MANSTDPAIAMRRLAQELRAARKATPGPRGKKTLTQEQVAEAMGWHPSKVLRIEQAKSGVSRNDLRALLELYGREENLEDLWRGISTHRRASRWRNDRDILSPEFIRYLEYEESAEIIREYQPLAIPALLQTADYARTMIELFAKPDDKAADKDRLLQVRLTRQRIWAEAGRCRLSFVLDQAAVSRWIGGRAVMRAQLEQLKEYNRRELVSVRVIPFEQGAHYGLAGPFTVLDFHGAAGRLLYRGEPSRLVAVDDQDVINPFVTRLVEITKAAASPTETDALLGAQITRLNSGDAPAS